jgi:glycosyltransferase involved in cell wall biosynthesis
MAEDVKISVIIATYNRAEFLSKTIDSLLQQEFRDFELIVVDDGSTDKTPQILKAYGDRLRILRQDNQGPSAARNLGVRHASAPWIAFQDSDDLSEPHHLATLYGYASQNPGCGLVFAKESLRQRRRPRRIFAHLHGPGFSLSTVYEHSGGLSGPGGIFIPKARGQYRQQRRVAFEREYPRD